MILIPNRQHGFSLIEVMIASLILIIGITGFATMQSRIVENDQALKLREMAMQIAKQKIEEFRYFEHNQISDNGPSFKEIANDQGGKSQAGEIEVIDNLQHEIKFKFEQHWQVVDQYFVDTDDDGVADKWVTKDDPNAPTPLSLLPDRKEVNISVEWIADNGNTERYELHTVIAPISLNRSIHAFNQSPDIELTAQVLAPDEVYKNPFKHKLTDDIVQSSMPLTIDQQQNFSSFNTFKYRDNNKAKTLVEKKEIAIVQCKCSLAGVDMGKTPTQIEIIDNAIKMREGQWLNKKTGIADPNQTNLCDSCCHDHHDNDAMLESQQFYRKEGNAAHKHYKLQNDGSYIQALTSGEKYDETCRFQRIDGDYQILADIHSIKTIVLPDSQLGQDQKAQYQSFVLEVLKSHFLQKTLPQSPFEKSISMSPAATQLSHRSIYIEPLRSDDKSKITQRILDGDTQWYELIPFYDLDTRLQAYWRSHDSDLAWISNEPTDMVFEPLNDRFASFSRGRLIALKVGSSQISSNLISGNEGLIGTPPISPYNLKQRRLEDSLELKISYRNSNKPTVGLVISIFCISTKNELQQACSEQQYAQLTRLQVFIQNKQANCNVEVLTPPNTSFINCSELPESWQGSIQIDAEKLDSEVSFSWRNKDKKMIMGAELEIAQPVQSTSFSDYWLIVEFKNGT